ncbi:hypothetical protein Hypma_011928 [Hypsizygus marmoreus]|uniref:Uncharacterized protein n=1 Tax=Hypsizygus marmoreus TaxID=39966 RepID=A0A369JR06_HYPMA|nr:hypothetical protein Hypma_011928 [Hypsizygus marmoreus]
MSKTKTKTKTKTKNLNTKTVPKEDLTTPKSSHCDMFSTWRKLLCLNSHAQITNNETKVNHDPAGHDERPQHTRRHDPVEHEPAVICFLEH